MRKDRSMVRVVLLVVVLMVIAAPGRAQEKIDASTALLIIDIQQFYYPGGALPLQGPEAASANVKKLIAKFRDEKRMVVHVGHNVSKEGEFHPDVAPIEGEKVFIKNEVSAFNGTALAAYLQENKIKRLVIVGMQTHMCVEGAVRAAYDLGFSCILVEDACATRDVKYGDKTIGADEVHDSTIGTLNGAYATVVDTKTFLENY
jgi:nicotinamidase-related amidase